MTLLSFGIIVLTIKAIPVSAQERPLYNQTAINSYYVKRGGEPFWISGKKLNADGEALWNALSRSWEHGLNPDNYYTKEISYILSQTAYKKGPDANLLLKLELLLTSGYVLYARDLSGMRVEAKNLGLDERDWKERVSAYEVLSLLSHNTDNMKIFLRKLGPQTATYQHLRQEMRNVSDADKFRQIVVNMERLRWVSDEKPGRFIVVNIPSERLWAIEDGNVRFSMPVAVGSKKRPTISFVTKIHGVRFNPNWTVPETVKKKDIWPKLKKDPEYLSNKGMELYSGYGDDAITLDPSVIDWQEISKAELMSFNMVQIPGDNNPLGRIRILMPNDYDIYLHDTNDKSVFSRHERAISSGCVRMSEPKKLALFALEKNSDWHGTSDLENILSTKETTDIYAHDRVTVYLLYYTVWLDQNRQIFYGNDIYGEDLKLWEELKKLDGIPKLRDNINRLSTSLE